MEKIKRDKNRVDLPAIEENSIEGGYIIKIDKATGDSSCESCYNRSFSFRSNYDGNGSLSENSPVYFIYHYPCLLYTSPSPRDRQKSRMPSSA